jgi:hypothetical protein
MSIPIQPPMQKHIPGDATLEHHHPANSKLLNQMCVCVCVCGKIHYGLDNQVSVNRKQNAGTEMAVLTAYILEFVKELLPYPKLLISYR